jgi:hypothetical protein
MNPDGDLEMETCSNLRLQDTVDGVLAYREPQDCGVK